MQSFLKFISWSFSILLFLLSVVCFYQGNRVIAGLLFFVAGVIINPSFIVSVNKAYDQTAELKGIKPSRYAVIPMWISCFIFTGIAFWILPRPDNSKNTTKVETPIQKEDPNAWLQGATLHNCTNAEWKAATQANKVATCSDWIAASLKSDGVTPEMFKKAVSLEQYKIMSETMAKEIDSTVATGFSADNMRGECAQYAVMYWILLKTKVKEEVQKNK